MPVYKTTYELRSKNGPDVPSLFCPLSNVRTGALISATPTAGDRPVEMGYHREAFMKLLFQATVALLSVAAWPAAAQPSPPAPTTLETLGAMHQTGSTADWPEVPQTGQKADQVKQNLSKIK
ncbi:MAG: hypothetical protein ACJ8EK_13425, partial [Bradyrhizobium sp.]